jgi:hypothetical protein
LGLGLGLDLCLYLGLVGLLGQEMAGWGEVASIVEHRLAGEVVNAVG